ncbi:MULTISPECIES: hypothetical protein [Ralstonia solanacearum species complex]|uniref:Uncharacterized protein n=2 Tax=Ralstonia TaxID=48736 RepID=A0AB33V8F2_RALSU|nr:hypothetical protein [Ralstonia solanacearum]ALF88231.1 hypothetical protein RSUY_18960 [Ralstonia solanacearum]ATI27695.1 hypothetical protein CCY86_09490 [Ralstonia solanacearum]ATJ86453.1 hypothetical protein CDC59_09410 [Ralstonia solanacearum]EAP71251.1 Hypothetical Protein RRSL_00682 [Ralstonia solanacearum UW551]KEI31058.1 signal peptide protein [Ralstonia solanacearum]
MRPEMAVVLACLVLTAGSGRAATAEQRDLNPTKDPDVQRGIDDTRRDILQRRQDEKNRSSNTDTANKDRSETDAGHRETDHNHDIEIDQSTFKLRGQR